MRLISIALSAFLLVAHGDSVFGQIQSLPFLGVITNVECQFDESGGECAALAAGIEIGATISGEMIFDSSMPDRSPDNPNEAFYVASPSGNGTGFIAGSATIDGGYNWRVNNGDGILAVFNNVGPCVTGDFCDIVHLSSCCFLNPIGPSPPSFDFNGIFIELDDTTPQPEPDFVTSKQVPLSQDGYSFGQVTLHYQLKLELEESDEAPAVTFSILLSFEPSNKCGNAVVDPGEQCDYGNLEDGDRCSSDCTCETATLETVSNNDYVEWEADIPRKLEPGLVDTLTALSGEEVHLVLEALDPSNPLLGNSFKMIYVDSNAATRLVGACNFRHGLNSWYVAGPRDQSGNILYFSHLRHVNIDGGFDDATTDEDGLGLSNLVDYLEYHHDVCRDRTITKLAHSPYNKGCEWKKKPAISPADAKWHKYTKRLKKCELTFGRLQTHEGPICPVDP